VTEWVAARAETARLSLTGKFRQLNASATFSLLRFETDGPALWFKAVGEPNVHEFSITLALARLFPHFVPRVIGHRADWNAWLSVEAAGTHLSDTAPLSNWQQAAATLADLQIASCGHGLHLIDAGSKDIRICSLVPHVEPFFERMAEVMELQTKFTPHPLARAEIRSLSEEVRSCLDELRAIDIPNTLGHLDFNPGNILVSPEQCVFLDWAEGSVGHPFFTFQYLLEHWRRFRKSEIDSEKALVSSYTVPWRAFASPDEIAKNLALAPLLAVFACATALGWNDPDACKRPVIAGYLRSLVRRMRRESDALQERRVTCAP
jgi:Phosphotransferase enzyme family